MGLFGSWTTNDRKQASPILSNMPKPKPPSTRTEQQRLMATLESWEKNIYHTVRADADRLKAYLNEAAARMGDKSASAMQSVILEMFPLRVDPSADILGWFEPRCADVVAVQYVTAKEVFGTAYGYEYVLAGEEPEGWWDGEPLTVDHLRYGVEHHEDFIREAADDAAGNIEEHLGYLQFLAETEEILDMKAFVGHWFPPRDLVGAAHREAFANWGPSVRVAGVSQENIAEGVRIH